MDFGNILSTAWKTIWKHKVIIWFGFLMAIPTALMGIIMGGIFFFLGGDSFFFSDPSAPFPDINPLFPILIVVAFFAFIIFSYAMTALSFAGVFKGTLDLQSREDKISFSELWDASIPYAGRVFGVMLIILFAIFFIIAIPMFLGLFLSVATAGLGFLCLMPLFLLILPLELVGYLFAFLAMTAVVADDIGVFDALRRAWEVMKQKFWSLVLMAVILAFIQWAVSMIVMLPMQIGQFAFMFPVMSENYIPDPSTIFRFSAVLMALFMPIVGLAQAFGLTYTNAAWMLTYLQLTAQSSSPEIEKPDNIAEYAA